MVYKKAKMALIVAGFALCASSTTMAEGMTGASSSMLANTCAGCHGTNGVSSGPATPTISGLSKDYFKEMMEEYASGEYPSTIMGRIAKGYSEEEIAQMADHFAGLPFVAAKQDFDKAVVDKGAKLHDKYCEKCHAEGGTSAEDDAGVLAGQWLLYTKWSLSDFVAGHRTAPKKMEKKLSAMMEKEGKDGLHALISYYASQQ